MSSKKAYQLPKSYRSRISNRSCFLAVSPYLWPCKQAVLSPLLSLCPCYFLHQNNIVSYMAGDLLIVFWGPALGSSQISRVDLFLYGTTPRLYFYLVLIVFYILLFSYVSFFPWKWQGPPCAGHQPDESENEGRTDMDIVVLTRSSWARGWGFFWLESLAGSRTSKVVVGWNPRLNPSGPDCRQRPGLVRVWALAADSAFVETGKEKSAKPDSPGPGEQVSC